jgi:AmmeMemoRadiSam system protein B
MSSWYPQNKEELSKLIDSYLSQKSDTSIKQKNINGLIVPHAGYAFSGEIAGKAFSFLKNQKNNDNKTAVILSPSHYIPLQGIATHNKQDWITPLGIINVINSNFKTAKINISQEHAIDNQIPFLQKLNFKNILPILVGEISLEQAKQIAKELSKIDNVIFVLSTDLSHFLPYEEAKARDKETIKAIENLDANKLISIENSACGIYPLLILIELCKLKNIKPKLIEYKNSGDITRDKSRVVGYCSMVF